MWWVGCDWSIDQGLLMDGMCHFSDWWECLSWLISWWVGCDWLIDWYGVCWLMECSICLTGVFQSIDQLMGRVWLIDMGFVDWWCHFFTDGSVSVDWSVDGWGVIDWYGVCWLMEYFICLMGVFQLIDQLMGGVWLIYMGFVDWWSVSFDGSVSVDWSVDGWCVVNWLIDQCLLVDGVCPFFDWGEMFQLIIRCD